MNKMIIGFLLVLSVSVYADTTTQSLVIPQYFQANCQGLTGTWQGFYTDPTDLFGNGGPWPTKVSLYVQGNQVIGRVRGFAADNKKTEKLWATCNNGMLSNIFVGDANHCGSTSKQGAQVSKNVLIMDWSYQNAMTGTNFLTVLHRVNNKYAYSIPTADSDFAMPKIQSCQ
jgi:hypothetical protein